MRYERVKDNIRLVQRHDKLNSIDQVSISSHPFLGSITFEPRSPFFVVSGQNGAGKTALLQYIKDTPGSLRCRRPPTEIWYINPSSYGDQLRAYLTLRADNKAGLKENNPFPLGQGAIEQAAELTGKNYTSIVAYESDADVIDGYPVILFEVNSNGREYSSENMGDGELSMLLLIYRLSRTVVDSVILIEEPEARTPDNRHWSILGLLLEKCIDGKFSLVITSHSSTMRDLVPDRLRFRMTNIEESRSLTSEEMFPPGRMDSLANSKVHVLVEDSLALGVIDEVVGDQARRFETFKVAGSGEIVKFLENTPRSYLDSPQFPVVAVFDGDEYNQKSQQYSTKAWWSRVSFLPGDRRLERHFKTDIQMMLPKLAETLNFSEAVLVGMLGEINGMDDHDWLHELARMTGTEYRQMCQLMFRSWRSAAGSDPTSMQRIESILAHFRA